jgi:hypothetical protein
MVQEQQVRTSGQTPRRDWQESEVCKCGVQNPRKRLIQDDRSSYTQADHGRGYRYCITFLCTEYSAKKRV